MYWVEISASEHGHGGAGWELGNCLWSPSTDRNGGDRYAVMREPRPGDIVFHLIENDGGRSLIGQSVVRGIANEETLGPPMPGRWDGFKSYFRIPIGGFEGLKVPVPLKEIEENHFQEIRDDITPIRPRHHPYVTYGTGIRVAQGAYLGLLTNRMVEIFSIYCEAAGSQPGTRTASVDLREYKEGTQQRRERAFFARHPQLRADAIKHYGTKCVVCGFDFETTYGAIGLGYIEIHHLEPISVKARGNLTAWAVSLICLFFRPLF